MPEKFPASIGKGNTVTSAAVLSIDKTPLPTINFESEAFETSASQTMEGDTPMVDENLVAAVEGMPHLTRQIIKHWGSRELNTMLHGVLLDSRDGGRQGFPHEVARELMFLAKLNVLVRAYEAAPLLGITVSEACQLIERGDHAALGHAEHTLDIWGISERARQLSDAGKPVTRLHSHHGHGHGHGHHAHGAGHHPVAKPPAAPAKPLAPELKEAPPVPPSVCIDLTTTRTLRHSRNHQTEDDGDVMDQGFFRCITKELGNLGIPQLVLSDLGNSRRCAWLPSAISFAKQRCHFEKVILHVDPLSAQEAQLILAIAAGLDQLVITVNLASGKWRGQAEAVASSEPDYFRQLIRRLVRSRDDLSARTGHYCAISVEQINHKSVFHLSQTFVKLTREPGLETYKHIAETKRGANAGACHCWSPFIEAHVRTNGHLVACAQDHSGFSFTANLKETTFTDAWHSRSFQDTRHRALHGDRPGRMCEICPHRAAMNAGPGTPTTA